MCFWHDTEIQAFHLQTSKALIGSKPTQKPNVQILI